MSRKIVFCLSIVTALLILSSTPQLGCSVLVWSETFDDLDSGIWNTQSCRLEDGRLRGMEINASRQERLSLSIGDSILAYRNSTISFGTWKLELEEIGNWPIQKSINDMTRVYFMIPDVPTDIDSYLALSFRHASSTEKRFFSYRIEKYFDSKVTLLDTYSGEAEETTIGILHQFAITRTSDGLITIYLNGTQILQAVDTDITTTQYFGFYTRVDWALDNIEVFDSIETSSEIPLVLVTVSLGFLTALVAVVLFIRRR
ncbi:MAG: hypothetical protein ACFFFO_07285 [Candidatus Thorarchaeota archaeon]